MKREEAFALHVAFLFKDAINNHTGILRLVSERLSPEVLDDVQGSLKELLVRQADLLQTKLKRATSDIKEFVGGEEEYRRLVREDFDADCVPQAEGWK